MIKALKVFGLFIAFTLFLSITVSGKPIFAYIYDVISPATNSAQEYVAMLFDKSIDGTQDYSKKLFDNSVPKVGDLKGKLSSKSKTPAGEPAEKILEEEKAELESLIKNHR